MWKRTSNDPLGRLLFERYGLHMLSRPREDAAVFNVFPVTNGRALEPGQLSTFLVSPFELPHVREEEKLVDIAGTTSSGVSGGIGFSFLKGFLAFIGVPGLVNALSASFNRAKAQALRFRFSGATRNHVEDLFDLQLRLRRHKFSPDDSPMQEHYRYYVATAVHLSEQISFIALDTNSNEIDLAAEVAAFGEAKANIEVTGRRELTATSDRPLVYGVELSELSYDARRHRIELADLKGFIQLRGGSDAALPGPARSMVGGLDDLMMLMLDH